MFLHQLDICQPNNLYTPQRLHRTISPHYTRGIWRCQHESLLLSQDLPGTFPRHSLCKPLLPHQTTYLQHRWYTFPLRHEQMDQHHRRSGTSLQCSLYTLETRIPTTYQPRMSYMQW